MLVGELGHGYLAADDAQQQASLSITRDQFRPSTIVRDRGGRGVAPSRLFEVAAACGFGVGAFAVEVLVEAFFFDVFGDT